LSDDNDDRTATLRRLVAMGIGRARRSIAIGYKAAERPNILSYLDPDTFDLINL
jgi:hypothetical protein